MRLTRALPLSAIAVAAAIAGCGGDDDKPRPARPNPDAQATQRLETYLKENVRARGSVTESEQIVNDVQVSGGQAKVFALLNSEIASDERPARKICVAVDAANVSGVKGAVIVDAGGYEIIRC